MKIHRFYNVKAGSEQITLSSNDARQIISVLRLKIGESVIFFDGKTQIDFEYELTNIEDKNTIFTLKKEVKNNRESKKAIHLYLSILKRDNFELALEKAIELGIKTITPILTERTIKKGINLERLQKISKEATEQSGRGIIPEILEPIKFSTALESAINPFILDPTGADFLDIKPQEASIFIGPEGGWTPKELELARAKKVPIALLAKTILRAETAAIISAYKALL